MKGSMAMTSVELLESLRAAPISEQHAALLYWLETTSHVFMSEREKDMLKWGLEMGIEIGRGNAEDVIALGWWRDWFAQEYGGRTRVTWEDEGDSVRTL